jgi:Ca2+-binding EF-hand superfamily protein
MHHRLTLFVLLSSLATLAAASNPAEKEPKSWQAAFKRADLNYSGGLSRPELAKLKAGQFRDIREQFNDMDMDRDGHVTMAEYLDFQQNNDGAWKAAFTAADTDRNGWLSQAELGKTKAKQFGGLKKRFARIDADKDQQISATEWDGYRKANLAAAGDLDDWEADFSKTDLDDSGGLSKNELAQACPKLFAGLARSFEQIDADKDGQVTSAEYRRHLDGSKAARKK